MLGLGAILAIAYYASYTQLIHNHRYNANNVLDTIIIVRYTSSKLLTGPTQQLIVTSTLTIKSEQNRTEQ